MPVPQPLNDALVSFADRSFHRFAVQNSIHCVPVDEAQENILDELNDILRGLLGRTVLPNISLTNIAEPAVLECGFGKGAWIDSLLGEHAAYGLENEVWKLDVTGVDIFLDKDDEEDDDDDDDDEEDEAFGEFEKKRWNLNAPFRDDRTESRLRPETFDLANSRLLVDGINTDRWPSYVKDLKAVLKPGGWLQMVELHMLFQSNAGYTTELDTRFLQNWYRWYVSSLEARGKDPRIGLRLGQLMTAAGFDQVTSRPVALPIGHWHPDHQSQGGAARDLMPQLLRSLSLWPFLRDPGGMPPAQYTALMEGAQAELQNSRLQLYLNVYVAWGQRPLPRRR